MEITNLIRGSVVHFQSMDSPPELFITDVVDELRRRYRFLEAPSKADEIDPEKGLRFALGRFEGDTIEHLEVYNDAVVARGPVATEVLDRFIEDISKWAVEELDITITPGKPLTRAYGSTLEVSLSHDLLKWANGLEALGNMLSAMVSSQGFDIAPFEVVSLAMHTEKEKSQPLHPARFVFERRIGHPYDANVFFSEAPVTTSDHKKLLDLLETLL